MKVKIGDKIKHTLFGGEVCVGIVEDIQICRQGMKKGRSEIVPMYQSIMELLT